MSVFPIKPLPRWVILPGDPSPLRRLLAQAAQDAGPADETEPTSDEDPRWQEAS